MSKRNRNLFLAPAALGVLVMLLLSGQASARPAQDACDPPCTLVRTCVVVPSGLSCQEHCECPGGETPAGTPFPLTPQPTPTPPQPEDADQEWCLPDECAAGQTRLWLVWYLYNLKIWVPVRPLEPCCGPSCPCQEPGPRQPCNPGTSTTCSEWGASVQASLPAWYADRQPYPRTMVTMDTAFWTSDANGIFTTQLPVNEAWGGAVDPGGDTCDCRAGGSCEGDPPPAGTICDYRLGLKAEPAQNTPPAWSCEDAGGGYGFQVSCAWEFSSAGKEYLGRGVDCEPLPAFTVSARVPYWWSFGRQWEQWEVVGGESECQLWPGFGTADCDRDGDGISDPDTRLVQIPIYGWRHHGPDWTLLDLRDYGFSTPYMMNPQVTLAPYRACGPHPVGALYVPCIEVQGLISNPKPGGD
jgi:hypothetical protein